MTGISTSTVPTLNGPVYSGKAGTGLSRAKYEASLDVAVASAAAMVQFGDALGFSWCGMACRSTERLH